MAAAIPKGHVYLARKILSSPMWGMLPEIRLTAITSIVLANHEDGFFSPKGRGLHPVKRGQFARCWKKFSDDCWIGGVQKTRSAVAQLEEIRFLNREAYRTHSLYTVKNYNYYQTRDPYGKERDLPEGYVLIARRIVDGELWSKLPGDRITAITCLLMANFQDGLYADENREVEVKEGTFISTPQRIAAVAKLDLHEVERALRILQGLGFVTVTSVDDLFLYSIPKYEFYQAAQNYQSRKGETEKIPGEASSLEVPTDQHVPGDQQAANKQLTSNDGPPDAYLETEKISSENPSAQAPEAHSLTSVAVDFASEPTSSQQATNKQPTSSQQEINKQPTRNKNGKNAEEEREGGEGEKAVAPPPPSLSVQLDLWGAPPPLPPDEQIATAYRKKFDGIMSYEKARKQGVLYLRKGGKLQEALAAIEAATDTPAVPIWKILDPLLQVAPPQVMSVSQAWLKKHRGT